VPAEETIRRQRIKDLQADMGIIDRQIADGEQELAKLRTVIDAYQAKVDVVPTRESELVELTRDYSTLQEAYSSLLKKREDAKLATNLERRQIGERFKILDPASLPEGRYNQKQRILALAGGAGVGLACGVLLVGFLEYRDDSFKSEADVLRALSLPVMALIPSMMTDFERNAIRRRRLFAQVAAVVIVVGSAAVLAVWKLR
jgi:uncharacterized protein involved in exopolysaccharide biosynthesis